MHADALREGVLVAPGFQFQCDGRPSRGLRLSIGQSDEDAIREAVRRLGKVVRDRLAAEPTQGGARRSRFERRASAAGGE